MRKKIIITLSHDIRGPLNAISGSAELAMDTRDRKRRNAYLGNILESSRHITRLANSLLDLSRLDDAKETLNEIPFHLESFLESIAEEYTRKANDKGLMFDKAFYGVRHHRPWRCRPHKADSGQHSGECCKIHPYRLYQISGKL